MGYEKAAHLYDLFDTKENIEFFLRYGSEAGEGNERPLTPACGGIFDTLVERGIEGVRLQFSRSQNGYHQPHP